MLHGLGQGYADSLTGLLLTRVAAWVRAQLAGSLLVGWLTQPLPAPPDSWGASALGRWVQRVRSAAAARAEGKPGALTALAAAAGRAAVAGLIILAVVVALVPVKRQVGPVPVSVEVILIPVLAVAWCLHWFFRSGHREVTGPGVAPSITGLPVTGLDLPLLLYLGILTVSLLQARSLMEGIQTVARQASFFLLYYMAVDLLRGHRRAIGWVIDGTLAGGLLVALIGLVQYALGLDLVLAGLTGSSVEVIRGRISSTQENPNFLSEYLILLIPLVVGRLLGTWRREAPTTRRDPLVRQGWAWRAFYLVTLVAMVAAEFLTYTRGGWLGLATALAVFVLLVNPRYLLVLAAAGAAAAVVVPGVLERLTGLLNFAEGSGAFRLNLYRAAIIMWSRSPWLGVGAGNYLEVYPDIIRDYPLLDQGFATYSSHNAFLTVAAETGVFGLLAFLVIVLLALRVAFSGWRHAGHPVDRLLFLGGGCGMVAFLVQSLSNITFFHPRVVLYYWLLLAVLLALGASAGAGTADRRGEPPGAGVAGNPGKTVR